jgi:UDPglucose 6-dehydrogenase
MNIAVIGSGYVGLVAGACIAELGHRVILVDNDASKYEVLDRGECPIHERFLPELLGRHRANGLLRFSMDMETAVEFSQAVFIAVGTPPTSHGEADLSYVECVARTIAGAVNDYKIIIGKSTVPVYTSEWIRKTMLQNGARADLFEVAANPEFLREGTAVCDFLYPDRIVIGCETLQGENVLRSIYAPLTDGSYYERKDAIPRPSTWVSVPSLIATKPKSAELIKYSCNAFLAMKISFVNAVATICESVGADVDDVRKGIGSDSRIGSRFLYPGIGYGGSCFPKDISAYRAVARECGYDFRLLEEVIEINDAQRERFVKKVRRALWTLKGKKLAVLGLAFKNGTDDIRESPAMAIIRNLLNAGCQIVAYDPAAMERAAHALPHGRVQYARDSYEACNGADALLILTEWDEFKQLDLTRVRSMLRYPIVIDGRNLFELQNMRELDFDYYSIGRPDVISEGRYRRLEQIDQLKSEKPSVVKSDSRWVDVDVPPLAQRI